MAIQVSTLAARHVNAMVPAIAARCTTTAVECTAQNAIDLVCRKSGVERWMVHVGPEGPGNPVIIMAREQDLPRTGAPA